MMGRHDRGDMERRARSGDELRAVERLVLQDISLDMVQSFDILFWTR